MGIHAQEALHHAMEFEDELDDRNAPEEEGDICREPHPLFDTGCQDAASLKRETAYAFALLDSNLSFEELVLGPQRVQALHGAVSQPKPRPKHAIPVNTSHGTCWAVPVKIDTKNYARVPVNPIWHRAEAKAKTFTMLIAFAKYVATHGTLSEKQAKIVETNWKGGSAGFIRDVQNNADLADLLGQMVEHFENLAKWTKAAGLNEPLYEFFD